MTGMYHSFGPFKGMCMLVMHLSVGIYGLAYIAHRDGAQPLQGLSPQDAEPAFYLIEPRGMGGGVVKMDIRMPRQPTVMLGFMDVQVIQDDMQFSARILGNNAIHEIQELTASPSAVVAGVNQSAGHFEGSEEGDSAMTFVLMAKPS